MSGCGDFGIHDMSLLADPCPLPDQIKKRTLNEKERLIYGPMSGVGGIIYDKDAIYIELGGSHALKKNRVCADSFILFFSSWYLTRLAGLIILAIPLWVSSGNSSSSRFSKWWVYGENNHSVFVINCTVTLYFTVKEIRCLCTANGITAVNSKSKIVTKNVKQCFHYSVIGQSTVDGDGGCNAQQQDDNGRENCRQSVQDVHGLYTSDV